MNKNFFAMALLSLAVSAAPVQAATWTNVDLNAGTLGGYTQIVSGAIPGVQAIPFGVGATENYLRTTGTGTFLYDFGNAVRVRFLHGSVDNYNTLQLITTLGNVPPIMTFVGNGDQGPGGTFLREFTFAKGTLLGFRFGSTSPAFEAGGFQVSDAVPEPATWLIMTAGFGLVGMTMRRRGPRAVAA